MSACSQLPPGEGVWKAERGSAVPLNPPNFPLMKQLKGPPWP